MRAILGRLLSVFCVVAMSTSALAAEDSIEQVMRRGTDMFWYDRAAWVTTDDMLSKLPTDRRAELGGWVIVPVDAGYHAYYHGKGEAADSIVYEADVVGNVVSNAMVWPRASAPRLNAEASGMARALTMARNEIARHRDWQPCTRAAFNTIVLPPEKDGSIFVYFLTPQTETGSFPFGGHYLVIISSAGEILSSRRFTQGCIALTNRPNEDHGTPAAMALTHLLDSHPTEIHVFQQYALGVPLYVGISSTRTSWKVESGLITKAEAGK